MSRNKKYKVIALSVSGRGNNVFHSGDVKEGKYFKNIDDLISRKFIEPLELDKKKEDVDFSSMKNSELDEYFLDNFNPDEEEFKDFEDLIKKEKIEELNSRV